MSSEPNKEIQIFSLGRAMILISYLMCFKQLTTEVSKPDPTAGFDVQEKAVQTNPVQENIYMPMKSL